MFKCLQRSQLLPGARRFVKASKVGRAGLSIEAMRAVPAHDIAGAAFGTDWNLCMRIASLHQDEITKNMLSQQRVLLVTSSDALNQPRINEVASQIQRCGSVVVNASIRNGMCDVESIQEAVNVARHVGVGAVVGCGSGGVLDAAKALSVLLPAHLPAREALLALERQHQNLSSNQDSSVGVAKDGDSDSPKTTLLASTPGADASRGGSEHGAGRALPCVLVPSCPSGAEANDVAVVHIGAGALIPIRPIAASSRELAAFMRSTEESNPDTDWTDPGTRYLASPSAEPVPVIRPDGSVGLSDASSAAATASGAQFMLELPPGQAATSGLACLAHAMESFLNLDAGPRTQALAMSAIARCAVALPALDAFIREQGPIRAWTRQRAIGTRYERILELLAEASIFSGAAMRYAPAGATRALAMAASARFELGYSAVAAACVQPVFETLLGMAEDGATEFEEDHETVQRLAAIDAVIKTMQSQDVEAIDTLDSAWKSAVSGAGSQPGGTVDALATLTSAVVPHIPRDKLRVDLLSSSDIDAIASGAEATDEMGHCPVELTRQDLVECFRSCA